MQLSNVSKALAGSAGVLLAGNGTMLAIPPDVQMPWWGYVLANVVYAAVGFLTVYLAPRNSGV